MISYPNMGTYEIPFDNIFVLCNSIKIVFFLTHYQMNLCLESLACFSNKDL